MNPFRLFSAGGSDAGPLGFVKRVGLIVLAGLVVALAAALASGQFNPFGVSNLLFWTALIVLGLAVFPALAELSSGVRSFGRTLADRDKSPPENDKSLRTLAVEKHEQRDKWLDSSLLFGTAGVLIFILSLLAATMFSAR